MLSLRSARGRAILAGALLVVLLASLATLAVWRTRDMQQQHDALHHTSAVATVLVHAQAQFWEAQASLSALILLGDPFLADAYHDTTASLEQNLSQARVDALAAGETDHVAALDDLAARIGHYTEQVNTALPIVLEADPETRVQLATASMSGMVSEAEAIIADLEELVEAHESDAATATAAADRAADTTLWLLIGFGAATLVVAVGAIAMLIVSVVRPLAALRASARAITSGDPEARARVSGPEEVTALARDFNEMTDALSAKTQEYIDTTNLTGDIIIRLDKDSRWAFLNDAACQFYGKPREELLGTDSRPVLHPEDMEASAQIVREARARKDLIRGFVNRQLTPLGPRVVEWNAYPLFDDDGQSAGLQATGRDITERKRAEEALQESESKHRTLLENLPQKIFSKDKNSVYISCNENYARDLNIKPNEITGKTDYDFFPKELAEKYRADDKRIMQSGKTEDLEEAYVQDGQKVFVHTVKTTIRDGDDNVVGILGVFWDITARKQAEEALRSSEERLKILFEFAPDAYYLNDLQGNFVDGNNAAQELIGHKREELVGKSFLELNLLSPEQLPKAAANLAQNAQGLPSGPDEFALNRKDGSQVPVEIRTFPVEIKGQTLVLGIARDITERKQAEEQREKALHDMGERMKELACMYRVTDLSRSARTMDESLQHTVTAISPGWHYPEIARAKVRLDGQEYVSQLFEETPWKQSSDIVIRGEKRGGVEVYYLEERPELDEGPFAQEERDLIDGLARVLSEAAERKQAEGALQESEERYRDLFENATDLVQSVRQDGSLVYVNRAWRRALGYGEDEIAALSLFDIIHPDSKAHCTKIFQRVMAGAKVDHIETMFLTKHGRTIWVEGSASCRFEDGKPVATRGIFHDVTERKQAQEERERLHAELQVRAVTDGLTGLYNHARFFERLAEEIDRSKRYGRGFALVMMDVDKFKQFNDTRGHQAGDDALCLVADCIRTGVRRSDIAFRYGGDEFAAILLHADSSRAQAIVKRINRCVTRRLEEANDPAAAWLGLSAGIACFPDDATTTDDLVKAADTALYDAKRVSRPCSAIEQEQAAEPLAAAGAPDRRKG